MPSAKPNIPLPPQSSPTPAVKTATPDLFIYNLVEDEGIIQDLTFEAVAAQELISLSRYDMVNGQKVNYRPIKNLSSLAIQYSPQTLVALQNPSSSYFNNFPIKIESKIPDGEADEVVYIEGGTGDLIINLINMDNDEQVEVQILTSGSVLDDTIY